MMSLPPTSFPTIPSTDSAALPFTESTSASPHRATSAKVPAAIPVSLEYLASLAGVRLPIRTS